MKTIVPHQIELVRQVGVILRDQEEDVITSIPMAINHTLVEVYAINKID